MNPRKWVLGCALAFAGLAGGFASADTISATITGVQGAPPKPYTLVDLRLDTGTSDGVETFNGVIAGAELWHRTGGATVGQGNDFQTYCIEIKQDVYLGSSYQFCFADLANAPKPGQYVTPLGAGTGMGSIRADLISQLWANDYNLATTGVAESAAFQLAVWEIVYEKPNTDGTLTLDLSQGMFKDTNDNAIRTMADGWLGNLSPNSTGQRANLVALTSDGAQDQITAAAPLPTTVMGGMALLAGTVGVVAVRRRRVAPV